MDAPPEAMAEIAFHDVGGTRLAVRTWGHGPPLLLVHGGPGGSGRYWLRLPPAIAKRRTLHAVDLRGHGLSERRGPYSIRRLASDLPALRERLAPEGCDILGHSFGAPVAIEAALLDPGFHRLTLVGGWASTPRLLLAPHGFGTKLALGFRLLSWNFRRMLGRAPATLGFLRALLARAAPLWVGPRTAPWIDEVLFSAVEEPLDCVVPLQWSLLRWSAWGRLSQLARPVHLIVGEHDRIAAPQAHALARRCGGTVARVVGAGHSPFLETPEEFVTALLGREADAPPVLSARSADPPP